MPLFSHQKIKTIMALFMACVCIPLQAYTLTIQIEPPGTADLVIDRADSYLSNDQAQPIAYFGGWDGLGKEGKEPATFTFKTPLSLPTNLHITWLDAHNGQFWGGQMPLPKRTMMQLLRHNPDEHFNRLIVSLAREGRLTLWLGSAKHEIQLEDEWQAEKVVKTWADFLPSLPPEQQKETFSSYVKKEKKRKINPHNDEMFVLKSDKIPVSEYAYSIVRDDGLSYCGYTNADGETRRVNTGTKTHRLSLYSGLCPLLENMTETKVLPTLVPNLIQELRNALPY